MMQLNDFLNTAQMTFENGKYVGQADLGFYGGSHCNSPESSASLCPTVSPAHSNTESTDSAFEDFLDGSFYDSRDSSPSQDFIKSEPRDLVDTTFHNDNLNWMSMPLDFDFQYDEENEASSTGGGGETTPERNPSFADMQPMKCEPINDIDFHNLEVILKEKAKQKVRQEQLLKCTQEEARLLQNVMLYKQQHHQGVMFHDPLNLPNTPPYQSPQQHPPQSSRQQTTEFNQLECADDDGSFGDTLPDDFLVKHCATLIDFINNPNATFPDDISSSQPPQAQPPMMTMPYGMGIQLGHNNNTYTPKPPISFAKPAGSITITKPRVVNASMPRSTSKPRLYNFLVELLKDTDRYTCIEWMNKEEGIFKFLDSAEVARLWGHRKNKPNMKYENFARSLRTYIAKGILTKPRNKLVYKFVKTVV